MSVDALVAGDSGHDDWMLIMPIAMASFTDAVNDCR